MKKIFFILVFTACLFTALYAGDSFKTGNSYYTAGQYDKALEQYGNFIKQEPKKFEGYYNAGDALFRQGQYEQALQMFNKSLELAPKDKDTRANIDVTQEKIKEQQQNQQQKQDQNQQQKQEQAKQDQTQQQAQKKNQMPKQEADRILEALRNNEKEIQKNLRKREAVKVKVEKDW